MAASFNCFGRFFIRAFQFDFDNLPVDGFGRAIGHVFEAVCTVALRRARLSWRDNNLAFILKINSGSNQ